MAESTQIVPGHNTSSKTPEEILEANISHVPVTDRQLRALFEALDTEQVGYVPLDVARDFYQGLEHYGVYPTDGEAEAAVRQFNFVRPEGLTFDEFSCFILKYSQI